VDPAQLKMHMKAMLMCEEKKRDKKKKLFGPKNATKQKPTKPAHV